MEIPVKEPNDGWPQFNLADKTLQQALSLRCEIEKYVDLTIHPLSAISSKTLYKRHGL